MTTLAGALLVLVAAQARADESYELKTAPVKAAVGAKTTASLIIAAKTGWHVNEEAPMSLVLVPDPGIAVEKTKLGKGDVAQKTHELARFDVAFTASEPGQKSIKGEAKFVMCQGVSVCKPVHETVALAIDVAAPAPVKVAAKKK
jgi:hypothetical protein